MKHIKVILKQMIKSGQVGQSLRSNMCDKDANRITNISFYTPMKSDLYRGYIRYCLNPTCGKPIDKRGLPYSQYKRKVYCGNPCRRAMWKVSHPYRDFDRDYVPEN